MKILKPGKVEMRKFVCPKCGCVFLTSTADIRTEGGYDGVSCPEHGCAYFMAITRGDPYEEPMQDDTARLSKLIADCPISLTALGVSASQTLRFADYLTENGVTFREG